MIDGVHATGSFNTVIEHYEYAKRSSRLSAEQILPQKPAKVDRVQLLPAYERTFITA